MSTSAKAELEYLIAYCNEAAIDGADIPAEKLQRIVTALRGAVELLRDKWRLDALDCMVEASAEHGEAVELDGRGTYLSIDRWSSERGMMRLARGKRLRDAIDAAGGVE